MSGIVPIPALPALPLLLWRTPPGLEMVLAQEGVPFRVVREPNRLAFHAGRFVLFDGRQASRAEVRALLSAEHVALDVDALRRGRRVDPFRALVDAEAEAVVWEVGGLELSERVARYPKGSIRRRLVGRLRRAVVGAGGVWARLSAFPHPYRSAFNFRVDLDEPSPDDYRRFARARRPLDDCSTHFVSTHAYGGLPEVLADLRRVDAQSHGHYHVIYRDPEANRANLRRAHAILADAGMEPSGFAAPHGRWNPGLDDVLEEFGYQYSSDFQLGYDDLPFFPWRGGRFSSVLQVPIHPVCEGLFAEAGRDDGRAIARHLLGAVRARVAAGEPAFVYGHPERRLARHPGVMAALAEEVERHPLLWRVTLTEFAAWWRWRAGRSWSLVPRGDGRIEVQFEDWDARYPLGLEFVRGDHVALLPVAGPRTALRPDALAYERRGPAAEALPPARPAPPPGWRARVREALDWETVTPVEDLPTATLPDRLKKGLRAWRAAAAGRPAG